MFGVLGFVLYLRRNAGRAFAVLLVIVLAVAEVSTVVLLTGSLLSDLRLSLVAPLHDFTEVVAAGAEVPPTITRRIAALPQTRLLLPMLPEEMRANTLLGPATRNVFAVPTPFMPWFLRQIGEHVVAGHLPAAGKNEVALPVQVMRNRHLRLGDWIGQDVDPSGWLPGEFRIVGTLDGYLQAGVVPYDAMVAFTALRDVPGVGAYAVFARPGTLPALNAQLDALPLSQVRVYTAAAESAVLKGEVRLLNWLIWTIDLVTVGVLALATGLLNNVYYAQRMEEYGILAAIGYSHGLLARRALLEVAVLTAMSWTAGLGLTRFLAWALERWVFGPQGVALPPLAVRDVLFTVPVPLLIGAFTLATVLGRLRRLDPVAIVERRD